MASGAIDNTSLHGFLIIDKPAGWTSHDVVARVRRLIGERHVGHAGTLDPSATGVLPLAVGSATKVLEYLSDESKTYVAEVEFGITTDSYDVDGIVTSVQDASGVTAEAVDSGLKRFRGQIEQLPPMHSAIKIGGKKLYELARKGESVERAPRPVTIHHLSLLGWEAPVATLLVDCSKGTYVRSLANDLGASIGTGAYLSNLVRVRTGPFYLCQAWTIAELEELDIRTGWPQVAQHPDEAILDWPAILLDDDGERMWNTGRSIDDANDAADLGRVYNPRGEWAGIATFDQAHSHWQPVKVIASVA